MQQKHNIDIPAAYFITFHTYGTWLHGDNKGSVDRAHNKYSTLDCVKDRIRHSQVKNRMKYPPYTLDKKQRDLVLASVTDICLRREWDLYTAHIRSNHVHCVLYTTSSIERVLTQIKANASRLLNLSGSDNQPVKRWVKHGSTRYLWNIKNVLTAIHYVVERQGEAMALYKNEKAYRELCESIEMF